MPAYSGFKNLVDYIEQRCARDGIARSALAEQFGWPRNYMTALFKGVHRPSRPRADKLAKHFGDETRLVRILAGLEAAPSLIEDKRVAEIVDLVTPLPDAKRVEAINYLKYLRDRK
jgi:plasmid maintenance system antidote protein VapI